MSMYAKHHYNIKKNFLNTDGGGGELKREEIYVYLWLIHVVVQQKATQHCKAIILQSKLNF